MKAFFIGLITIVAVVILAGIGVLLFPFLVVLGWILRLILSLALVIFAIWLLGKLVLIVWEKLREKD
ncbi:MAG: hypothetical protein AMJ78_04155 [Omnitrophica WOR_2 bacterium SM23_29]|nr:MAG: hypothetical protein AMJ78_04155 [Omnitrophica WOR_2 bacterium SM23_29]